MADRVPTVDVITVPWNHKKFMEPLFEGLRVVDYPRDAFVVHLVDNASSDGTADEIRRLLATKDNLPKITLHEPGSNLGFAGGNNLIMKASTADYVLLLNPDAIFEPGTLREVVAVAEAHPNAASVQPVLVLAQDPGTINSIGNDIHFAGFGYCRGYMRPVAEAPKEVTQIAYASGAGVLIRTSALRKIGLFDETLFAYHEDLDLGWRMLLAGYDNLLAPKSVLRHHYEFSRSISKWYWMERNRFIVLWKHERFATLLLTLPALLIIEIATWLFAWKGGWLKEKQRATSWFFQASSWKYLFRARREVQALRKRSDHDILKRFLPGISYQEVTSPFMETIANPLMTLYFNVLKVIVFW
jgi:GT2 family glycosyltransferase